MQKFYMVLQPQTNYTRYRHNDYQAAKTEAMKLARNNPGQEFIVLLAICTVAKQDVIVDEVPCDEIPF